MLRQFSIKARIMAIISIFTLGIAVLLVVIMGIGSLVEKYGIDGAIELMVEGERNKLKLATNSVAHILGKRLEGVTDDKERAEAIAAYINTFRFEEDKSGYFFVYRGTTVFVHPVQPALVGKDLGNTKDVNGVFYVRELSEAAKKGGGFVSFVFGKPQPNGTVADAPKLAYVEMIPGTDLWVSTGIYIDNVDRHKAALKKEMDSELARVMYMVYGGIAVVGLLILLPLCVLIVRSLTGPLRETTMAAERIAAGDLDIVLSSSGKDEISMLQRSLAGMVRNLRSSLANVQTKEAEALAQAQAAGQAAQAAEDALKKADEATREMAEVAAQVENVAQEVQAGAGNISEATDSVHTGAETQKGHISEIMEAMASLSASASEIAASAANAADKSEEAKQEVESGTRIAEQTGGAMQQLRDVAGELKENTATLGKQSEGIGHIMSVINDIADQTNLLALNAAIEAARAGDAGRGFAVVADEVRKLAEKTMVATKEVHSSIKAIQDLVQLNSSGMDNAVEAIGNVSRLSSETADSLKNVLELVGEGAHQMGLIARAVDGQSSSSTAVTELVNNVNAVAEHNEEMIAAAESRVQDLRHKAGELLALVASLRK